MIKHYFFRALVFFALVFICLYSGWFFLKKNSAETLCEKRGNCPNIVLIILDDMPWSHFGFLSKSTSVTPHLDDLAKKGFVFRNVYNTNSRCRASLATYLTGQLPHQNLIYSNQGVLKLHDDKALIRLLAEAGYATFVGGKLWEGTPEQLKLTDYDLDTFHFVRKSQSKLTAFLDRYSGHKPVFIWWAPLLPHKNHNAPEQYFAKIDPATIPVPDVLPEVEKETYRRAEQAFLATISWVDDEVGKLMESMADHGMADNTWIMVLSDNGWSNLYPAKGAPYDIGVRTPLMINGPDVIQGATDTLVSTQNIYGSILQLAGLEASDDRKESLNVFTAAAQEDRALLSFVPETVYWASYPSYTGKAEPHPRAGRDVYALSLREDNWQYTFYVKAFHETGSDEAKAPAIIHTGLHQDFDFHSGDEELFNLQDDPFSENNLSSDINNQILILEFRKKVFEWWRSTGGKEIDAIENCKNTPHLACEKYYQVYPEKIL